MDLRKEKGLGKQLRLRYLPELGVRTPSPVSQIK